MGVLEPLPPAAPLVSPTRRAVTMRRPGIAAEAAFNSGGRHSALVSKTMMDSCASLSGCSSRQCKVAAVSLT